MLAAIAVVLSQQIPADTARRVTTNVDTLPAIVVSVTRAGQAIDRVPGAISVVGRSAISRGRPTHGLDEALSTVAGVYASNRFNFSLDQRISIRGFGARSSFGIRGIKVLLDDIPQTLPDGSGQLTNVELGASDDIEVLRGPSSALFGNASGGVISIHSSEDVRLASEELRVTAGSFDRRQVPIVGAERAQTWAKWVSTSTLRVGPGWTTLVASRLSFGGERQHSNADLRSLNLRYFVPSAGRFSVAVTANYGDDPRADNAGALTAAELARNPDSAAAINLSRRAGKDVRQLQGGVSVRRLFDDAGEASLAVFGFSRRLRNPQTFAYIDLDRTAFGSRFTAFKPLPFGGRRMSRLTAGLDFQRQRDDRLNVGNVGGVPDTVRQLDQLEHVTEVGPFAQAVLDLPPRTTLTAGARYDWVTFAADDRLVTPSNPDDSGRRVMRAPSVFVGATHQLHGVTLYANVGTSFETPTTTELANRPDTAGGFNALLNPQHALSYEIGVRGASGRLSYALSAFRAGVRGALIAYAIPASPGRVFYQNAGRSRNQGLELETTLALARDVSLSAAWTWSDFRYTSYTARGIVLDGRRIPGIPEHWLHLVWSARPSFARGGWLEIQQTISSSVLVDDTLSTRAAAWHTVDVRAGWEGTIGRTRVAPFLALNNVFDRHYVSSVVINAANGRYYEPAPGRNAYVGLTIGVGR